MKRAKQQISPVTILKVQSIEEAKQLCLCKTFKPMLFSVRLLGLFPITWEHTGGRCVYRKSAFWMIYSFAITCLYIYIVATSIDIDKLANSKCLIIILNEITNGIYGCYIVLLTVIAYIRFPRWISALTQLSKILQDGLYCQSAMRISIRTQYAYIVLFSLNVLVHLGLLIWLHMSPYYQITFNYIEFIYRLLRDISYGFQAQFTGFVIVMSGILACFEKLTKALLQYTPLHPDNSLDYSNANTDFVGLVTFNLCKGSHQTTKNTHFFTPAESTEYLRIKHEDVSLCIYTFNDAMNPQFLLHTVVELVILIIHWYATVAYFVYTFKDPAAMAIHLTNCYYIFMHSTGVFLFLKSAQLLKNLVSKKTTVKWGYFEPRG